MCVTNFVKRQPKPLAVVANPAALSSKPSLISQRLHGSLLPMLASIPVARPATETSLNNNVFSSNVSNGYPISIANNIDINKPKAKRRRKPQKPGLTAKKNERHFVKHDYHDHALDTDESDGDERKPNKPCSTTQTFPMKLHSVLERVEADGFSHIVSWQPHGRCFCIHKPREFAEVVLPTYLRQGKLTSFQRQLNLYGFQRLTRGKDAGAYYHELFLRGKGNLTKRMKRTKIKGTKFKAASSPDQEPDFYAMPPVTNVAPVSDESSEDSDSYKNDCGHPMQVQLGSVLEFDSSRYDPIPLHVPQSQVVHTPIQQFGVFGGTSSPNNTQVPSSMLAQCPKSSSTAGTTLKLGDFSGSHSMMMNGFNLASTSTLVASQPISTPADQVLDDAVDELFSSNDVVSEGVTNYEDLWNPVGLGGGDQEIGQIDNDFQLGNLLESFLEQT